MSTSRVSDRGSPSRRRTGCGTVASTSAAAFATARDHRPPRRQRPLGGRPRPPVVGASVGRRHRSRRRRTATGRTRCAHRDRDRTARRVASPVRPGHTMATSTASGRGATATVNARSTGRPRCARAISWSSTGTAAPIRVGSCGSTGLPTTPTWRRAAPGGRSMKEGAAAFERRQRSARPMPSRSPTWTPRHGGAPPASLTPTATEPRWQRRSGADADLPLTPPARWVTAAATLAALALLVGALGSSLLTIALLAAGTIAGAVVTTRLSRSGGDLPTWSRLIVASVALAGVAAIAVGSGQRVGSARRAAGTVAAVPHAARRAARLRVHRPAHGAGRAGDLRRRRHVRGRAARRRPTRLVARRLGRVLPVGDRPHRTRGWTGRRGRPLGHFCVPASGRRAGAAAVRGPRGAAGAGL